MRQFDNPARLIAADGRQLDISPMMEADIAPLASMYRKVWIKRDIARRVLDADAPLNFKKRGGMFLIQDPESLARLLEDPSEYVWVAREGVRPLGALWCGLKDEKYRDLSRIMPHAGFEDLPEHLRRGLAEGTLYFSKEVIVAPDERGLGLSEALIDTAMRFFHARGYRQSCGEVYYVHAMRDGAGELEAGLFNEASFQMLLRTGCRLEGEFAPCIVNADGFDARISMRIVRWVLEPSLQASKETLAAAGISRGEHA